MILDVGLAVRVVTAIRTHTALQAGCPEWDAEGVRAMLVGSEGSPGAVLAAACLAAEDSSLRKPSPTALRNHWPVNATTTPPARRQVLECPEHRQPQPCPGCEADRGPELTPEQIAKQAQLIKTQIAAERARKREQAAALTNRQETTA